MVDKKSESSVLDANQVEKAVCALQKHCHQKPRKNEPLNLFQDDGSIVENYWLIISFKKIPEKAKPTPKSIPLKHSLLSEHDEVCLITKDPQRPFKDLIKKLDIKPITKVIGVGKLSKKFKQFEARRMLSNQYALFLADKSVLELLPGILGKQFFKKKKLPIGVDLGKSLKSTVARAEQANQKIKMEIEKALSSTSFYLTQGACSAVKIAHDKMEIADIVENIMHVIPHILTKVPYGKIENVQSIHLKTRDSISFPLYNSMPNE